MSDSSDKLPDDRLPDDTLPADKLPDDRLPDDKVPADGPPPGSPETIGAVHVTTGSARGRYLVHVRCGALPTTGAATATAEVLGKNDPVVLRTNRGTELGIAVTHPEPTDGDVGETIGHVLRRATDRDLAEERRIEDEFEPEEFRFCQKKISERGLRMRLSSVEHIFGGERIVFYFTAERRVDFRALVRDLAWHFHTRIELRQIGARDEARLLADFEHCGRPLCCKVFLRHLEPVTMRMAKLQRTTLDPQKISGRCGRLMCCLRFEDQVYRELRKGLPHKGTRVHLGDRAGEVVSTDILTQRATVKLEDGEVVRVPVKDLRPPPDGDAGAETDRQKKAEGAGAPARGEAGEPQTAAPRSASSQRGDRRGGKSGRGGPREKPRRPSTAGPGRRGEPVVKPQEGRRGPRSQGAPSKPAAGRGDGGGRDQTGEAGRQGGTRSVGRRRRRSRSKPPERGEGQ